VEVIGTGTSCAPAQTSVPAGVTTFRLRNNAGTTSELYVLRADRTTVVGERENIAAGASSELTVELGAGTYHLRCKPGGEEILASSPITVSGSAGSAASAGVAATAAVVTYRGYVLTQTKDSLGKALAQRTQIEAGNVAAARTAYAASRIGWERIEPVAESFGNLDPRVDLREADLESGQTWTGWHVIEKSLWAKRSTAGMAPVADRLVRDLQELVVKVPTAQITPTSMANGAKELLDEVATGKVTGEEEAFSHLDLVDLQANVDGAAKVFELFEPIVRQKDPALGGSIGTGFDTVNDALRPHRTGAGPTAFVRYSTVTDPQRKQLAQAVDGLAEPLSRLAAVVAS
jgi:iron uptake system component EfeO